MLHRRSSAIASGVLLLALPVLASCGFDYATNRVNTISAGVNERSGDVDVLGAVVIAEGPNAGVFVATLANNNVDEADAFTTFVGGENGQLTPVTELAELAIPRSSAVSLFTTGGVPVTGTFEAGDFVDVTLGFADGSTSTLVVPVVTACNQYSLDKFPELELPAAPTPVPLAEESVDGTLEPSTYPCEIEHADLPAHGEEPEAAPASEAGE